MQDFLKTLRSTRALYLLILVNCALFLLENILMIGFHTNWIMVHFGLSSHAVMSGEIWTLFSYSLLHESVASGGLWHILFNMLALYFIGRELEPRTGQRDFYGLYFFCALLGGITWLATQHFAGGGILVGASVAVLGMLTVFCLLYPEQPITLLLFFVLPITVLPKWVLWAALAIESLGFLFVELQGSSDGVAHSAHLGGMLGGYLFYRYLIYSEERGRAIIPFPKRKSIMTPPSFKIQFRKPDLSPEEMRSQVDKILDKINDKGFGSLTDAERSLLEHAKSVRNKP